MGEPILRDGQWWYRNKKGEWLRWDLASKQWRSTVLEPPPAPIPPPPPAGEDDYLSGGAETTPLETPRAGKPPKAPKPSKAPKPPETLETLEPLERQNTLEIKSTPAPRDEEEFPMGPPDRRNNLAIAIGVGVLALFLIVFAAVKIFGGNGEPTPEPTRGNEAKEAYIADADELCVQARALEAALDPPRSDKELLDYASRVLTIRTSLGRKIQRLEPPKGDEKVLTKMSKSYGTALRHLALTVEHLREGDDRARAKSGQKASAFTDKFNKMAKNYGFKECSKIGEPA